MTQLFPRLTSAATAALVLAAAMSTRPLTAATAEGRQDRAVKNSPKWTKSERLDLIKRAQVWMPTNIPSMDLRLGPHGPEAFQPWQEVTCDYVYKEDLPGTSRKFDCAITKDDVVKVRYGEQNGKVEGEVAATRLLWALGFGA